MMFSTTHLYQLKAWSIIFIKEIDLCWLFIHFLLVSAHHSLLPHLFLEFHLPCDLSWVPGLSLCHYAWACPLHVLLDLSLLFFVSFFLSTLVSGWHKINDIMTSFIFLLMDFYLIYQSINEGAFSVMENFTSKNKFQSVSLALLQNSWGNPKSISMLLDLIT